MEKIVIRSAYFTDHQTKRTAVGISVNSAQVVDMQVFCSQETYGQLWLSKVAQLLRGLPLIYGPKADLTISFISGQPQCAKMAEKIERIFVKMLESKKPIDDDRIKALVAADGNHKFLPNDKLYEGVLQELWKCRESVEHLNFEQHHMAGPESAKVFNAARSELKKAPL